MKRRCGTTEYNERLKKQAKKQAKCDGRVAVFHRLASKSPMERNNFEAEIFRMYVSTFSAAFPNEIANALNVRSQPADFVMPEHESKKLDLFIMIASKKRWLDEPDPPPPAPSKDDVPETDSRGRSIRLGVETVYLNEESDK